MKLSILYAVWLTNVYFLSLGSLQKEEPYATYILIHF